MTHRINLTLLLTLGIVVILIIHTESEDTDETTEKSIKNSPIHLVHTFLGFPFRGQGAGPLFSLLSPFHRFPYTIYNKSSTVSSTTSTTTTTTTEPPTTKPPPPSDVPQLLSKSSDHLLDPKETSKTIYIPLKFVSNAKPYKIVVQDPQNAN